MSGSLSSKMTWNHVVYCLYLLNENSLTLRPGIPSFPVPVSTLSTHTCQSCPSSDRHMPAQSKRQIWQGLGSPHQAGRAGCVLAEGWGTRRGESIWWLEAPHSDPNVLTHGCSGKLREQQWCIHKTGGLWFSKLPNMQVALHGGEKAHILGSDSSSLDDLLCGVGTT